MGREEAKQPVIAPVGIIIDCPGEKGFQRKQILQQLVKATLRAGTGYGSQLECHAAV